MNEQSVNQPVSPQAVTRAPADGREAAVLLQDFVNTLDVECDDDAIATPGRLGAWLAERGLLPGRYQAGEAGPADLATAVGLREGLRAAMLGHHGPDAPDRPAELGDALARLPLRVTFEGERPVLVPVRDGVKGALARIAAAMMTCAADGTWSRLKVCQEDTCRWAFLDTSKNRSRAWCSMRVCGNRTKTRAYRARRRPAPGPPPGA